jgi:ribosome modulation factor
MDGLTLMSEPNELQSWISRLRSEAKVQKEERRAFEDGQTAFLSGEAITACRLKLPARRNAWERGWHEAKRSRIELEAIKTMTAQERKRIKESIETLRSQFDFLKKEG